MTTTPRDIVLKRRRKVEELFFVREYSVNEIAEVLNWSERTIWRDIETLRQEYSNQFLAVDVRKLLMRIFKTRSKSLQKLWKITDEKNELNSVKISALRSINEIQNDTIKNLQELGYIAKPTENINLNEGNKEKSFAEVYKEALRLGKTKKYDESDNTGESESSDK